MALTDIVYKRKKDDQLVAIVIAAPTPKDWAREQVIRYDMVYYKLSSIEMLSPKLKYPYRYTLVPIQHDENIDLVKSNALTYTPETTVESSDIAKAFGMQFTAPLFGLIVSLMPESWQKAYRNINPFYHASRSTVISGVIQAVTGLAISISAFMGGSKPIMSIISSWLFLEGMFRVRLGLKMERGFGSLAGMVIALPVELLLWIAKLIKKSPS